MTPMECESCKSNLQQFLKMKKACLQRLKELDNLKNIESQNQELIFKLKNDIHDLTNTVELLQKKNKKIHVNMHSSEKEKLELQIIDLENKNKILQQDIVNEKNNQVKEQIDSSGRINELTKMNLTLKNLIVSQSKSLQSCSVCTETAKLIFKCFDEKIPNLTNQETISDYYRIRRNLLGHLQNSITHICYQNGMSDIFTSIKHILEAEDPPIIDIISREVYCSNVHSHIFPNLVLQMTTKTSDSDNSFMSTVTHIAIDHDDELDKPIEKSKRISLENLETRTNESQMTLISYSNIDSEKICDNKTSEPEAKSNNIGLDKISGEKTAIEITDRVIDQDLPMKNCENDYESDDLFSGDISERSEESDSQSENEISLKSAITDNKNDKNDCKIADNGTHEESEIEDDEEKENVTQMKQCFDSDLSDVDSSSDSELLINDGTDEKRHFVQTSPLHTNKTCNDPRTMSMNDENVSESTKIPQNQSKPDSYYDFYGSDVEDVKEKLVKNDQQRIENIETSNYLSYDNRMTESPNNANERQENTKTQLENKSNSSDDSESDGYDELHIDVEPDIEMSNKCSTVKMTDSDQNMPKIPESDVMDSVTVPRMDKCGIANKRKCKDASTNETVAKKPKLTDDNNNLEFTVDSCTSTLDENKSGACVDQQQDDPDSSEGFENINGPLCVDVERETPSRSPVEKSFGICHSLTNVEECNYSTTNITFPNFPPLNKEVDGFDTLPRSVLPGVNFSQNRESCFLNETQNYLATILDRSQFNTRSRFTSSSSHSSANNLSMFPRNCLDIKPIPFIEKREFSLDPIDLTTLSDSEPLDLSLLSKKDDESSYNVNNLSSSCNAADESAILNLSNHSCSSPVKSFNRESSPESINPATESSLSAENYQTITKSPIAMEQNKNQHELFNSRLIPAACLEKVAPVTHQTHKAVNNDNGKSKNPKKTPLPFVELSQNNTDIPDTSKSQSTRRLSEKSKILLTNSSSKIISSSADDEKTAEIQRRIRMAKESAEPAVKSAVDLKNQLNNSLKALKQIAEKKSLQKKPQISVIDKIKQSVNKKNPSYNEMRPLNKENLVMERMTKKQLDDVKVTQIKNDSISGTKRTRQSSETNQLKKTRQAVPKPIISCSKTPVKTAPKDRESGRFLNVNLAQLLTKNKLTEEQIEKFQQITTFTSRNAILPEMAAPPPPPQQQEPDEEESVSTDIVQPTVLPKSPFDLIIEDIFAKLVDKNETEMNEIVTRKICLNDESNAKGFVDGIFHFFQSTNHRAYKRKHIFKTTYLIIVSVIRQYQKIYPYYYSTLLNFLPTGQLDSVIALTLSNINFYLGVKQWDFLMNFLVALLRLQNIPIIRLISYIIPQHTFPSNVHDKYSPVIDILKRIVTFEYSTTQEVEVKKIVDKMSLVSQRFWLQGQVVEYFSPTRDLQPIIRFVKKTMSELASSLPQLKMEFLDRDLEKKYLK